MLRVQDEGRGIAAALQPRVFDLFARAGPPQGGQDSGLGIGLGVVKELVVAHNGTVSVRSEGEGKGSEFVVRLPLEQPRASACRIRRERSWPRNAAVLVLSGFSMVVLRGQI